MLAVTGEDEVVRAQGVGRADLCRLLPEERGPQRQLALRCRAIASASMRRTTTMSRYSSRNWAPSTSATSSQYGQPTVRCPSTEISWTRPSKPVHSGILVSGTRSGAMAHLDPLRELELDRGISPR